MALHAGNQEQRQQALQLSKSYLQLPSNRNDLRYYILYIDICNQNGNYEEAKRIAYGSLKLLPRLGASGKRYLCSILFRLISSIIEENSIPTEVTIQNSIEKISLWKEESCREGLQLIKEHLLPNESNQSEVQLEKKLIYLLKIESDYLKQVDYSGI